MRIDVNCLDSVDPNASVEELYPAGTAPEDRRGSVNSLCALGPTPRLLSGMLRQLLTQHFVDPNQIVNFHLRQTLQEQGAWKEDVGSGILIESIHRWRPEQFGALPALLIKDGDWTWRRVGIGNQAGGDWRTGERFFSGMWAGSHVVFAISSEPAAAQLLAAETAKLLLYYSEEIEKHLNLRRFEVVRIGALSALQEADGQYVSPVDMAYIADETWLTQPDAPRLKRVVFRADDIVFG